MTLQEALKQSGCACKYVTEPVAGFHTVQKPNLSAGLIYDFLARDPERRSPFATSFHYGYGYPGANPYQSIVNLAGEDGWEPYPSLMALYQQLQEKSDESEKLAH